MAFRTRRQARYETLRLKGFLPFEARPLSFVPRRVPYIPILLRGRARLFNRAQREGWSKARYYRHIKGMYADKDWFRRTRTGRRVYDPWSLLRAAEDRYRDRHPEYVSPWMKRQKRFRDFISRFEATLEKYPRGGAYPGKAEEYRRLREETA